MADAAVAGGKSEATSETNPFSGPQPLPATALTRLQPAFGRDLRHVRLHADESAAVQASALRARAFTSGNDIFFQRGALRPDTEPGMRLLAHEVAHTVQQSEGRASAGIAQRKEDWDFTPADYDALIKAKGTLTFGADSAWFPKALQDNLLATLEFALKSKAPARTAGVNIKDFYHGHFTVPKDALTSDLSTKRETFNTKEDDLEAKALGGKSYNDVTKENLPAYTKAMQQVEKLATPLLEDALKVKGAAVFYHTFEMSSPSGMKAGSPTRNIMTPIGGSPSGYDPSGSETSANQFRDTYSEILQFAFLVDEKGVIHVTVGTIPNLSRVTGTPLKS